MFVCQALFLGLYQLFKSEPFFRVNRVYLIFSLVLSLVLPLFSFSDILPFQVSQTYIEWMQPVQIGLADAANQPTFSETQVQAMQGFQWNLYYAIYGAGLTLYIVWFIFRNRLLFKYLNLNSFEDYKIIPVVILPYTNTAFSFLGSIYIGKDIPENHRQVILEHEYQHIQKNHSWDLLFVEVLQFVMWFNPMIYIYKLQLRQLHEFEVDYSVTSQYSVKNYINTLLNQSFGSQNVSFVHTFSRSSELKKRIKMLRKTKKTPFRTLKYLLIIPVLAFATLWSCSQDEIIDSKLTEKEIKEEMIVFMNRLNDEDPSLFKHIKQKPSLEKILKQYNLQVKDSYTEMEEQKVGFILIMVTIVSKSDESYNNQIIEEINNSKGLKIAFEKVQNIVYGSKNFREETQDLSGMEDIPFALLDNPPHPQSCNGLTADDLKKCMSDFISKHVNHNFDTKKIKDLESGRYRVSVQFKIDNKGKVTNVQARGPSTELEAEAIRAVKTIPDLIPGEVDGQKVGVLYGLPINFIIAE
jgi:hypothetical protein